VLSWQKHTARAEVKPDLTLTHVATRTHRVQLARAAAPAVATSMQSTFVLLGDISALAASLPVDMNAGHMLSRADATTALLSSAASAVQSPVPMHQACFDFASGDLVLGPAMDCDEPAVHTKNQAVVVVGAVDAFNDTACAKLRAMVDYVTATRAFNRLPLMVLVIKTAAFDERTGNEQAAVRRLLSQHVDVKHRGLTVVFPEHATMDRALRLVSQDVAMAGGLAQSGFMSVF